MSDQEKDLGNLGIPTPSNAKPGDQFYNNVKTSDRGGGLKFEPPAELIELPSHGYLYKDVTDDPDILENGSIRIRPMTVHEERILTTPRLVKSGQALNMVFENVIKSQGKNGELFPVNELLSSDRIYLMLWLRSVSYGNVYKFEITCPNTACGRRFEYEVNLSEHPITELSEDVHEPLQFKLPISKYSLSFRLPRGKDEMEVMKSQNQPKKMNETDDTIVQRMTSIVQAVYDHEGNEIPKNQINDFLESMIAGDASAFRNYLEEVDAGIDDIHGITCPYCEYEFDRPIPITENFFRTT